MRRRAFIAALGGAAAWPVTAHGQQALPVIGFIYAGATSSGPAAFVTAFRQGLSEAGFVEGKNLAVEYRYSTSQNEQLGALVAEFVHRPVAVLVGNTPPAVAAKRATSTIPIVFVPRTSEARPCRELQPSWRQCDGRELLECGFGSETARNAARTASSCDRRCCVGRPEFCHQRRPTESPSRCGRRAWLARFMFCKPAQKAKLIPALPGLSDNTLMR